MEKYAVLSELNTREDPLSPRTCPSGTPSFLERRRALPSSQHSSHVCDTSGSAAVAGLS